MGRGTLLINTGCILRRDDHQETRGRGRACLSPSQDSRHSQDHAHGRSTGPSSVGLFQEENMVTPLNGRGHQKITLDKLLGGLIGFY